MTSEFADSMKVSDIEFIQTFREMTARVHTLACEKGWWADDRSDGECIALMHSELSEALEALRARNPPDTKVAKFTSLEVELADCIIRIMDFAGKHNLRIAEALVAKHNFNKTRPRKHGKVF